MLLHSAGLIRIPYMDRLELQAYDARIQLTAPGSPHSDVLIIDLDEKSLAQACRYLVIDFALPCAKSTRKRGNSWAPTVLRPSRFRIAHAQQSC